MHCISECMHHRKGYSGILGNYPAMVRNRAEVELSDRGCHFYHCGLIFLRVRLTARRMQIISSTAMEQLNRLQVLL